VEISPQITNTDVIIVTPPAKATSGFPRSSGTAASHSIQSPHKCMLAVLNVAPRVYFNAVFNLFSFSPIGESTVDLRLSHVVVVVLREPVSCHFRTNCTRVSSSTASIVNLNAVSMGMRSPSATFFSSSFSLQNALLMRMPPAPYSSA